MARRRNENTDDILSMMREGLSNAEIAEAYSYANGASVSWIKTKYKRLVQSIVGAGGTAQDAARDFDISLRNAEWLATLPECERGHNNERKESVTMPERTNNEFGRVINAHKITVQMIHWDTDSLLDIIDEEGYYILDVSNPTSPTIKLLSDLSMKEFKEYSQKPGAALIKAARREEKPGRTVNEIESQIFNRAPAPVVTAKEEDNVKIRNISPAFEEKYDDWRNVPTPVVFG